MALTRAPRTKLPPVGTVRGFVNYGKKITTRAFTALVGRGREPRSDAEIALHLAYNQALFQAKGMEVAQVETIGRERGVDLCRRIEAMPYLVADSGLSSSEFVAQYAGYNRATRRRLARLWKESPPLAEAISAWYALNDIYEFAMFFRSRTIYKDDARRIRARVGKSLKRAGLLGIWKKAAKLAQGSFAPQPLSLLERLPHGRPLLRLIDRLAG